MEKSVLRDYSLSSLGKPRDVRQQSLGRIFLSTLTPMIDTYNSSCIPGFKNIFSAPQNIPVEVRGYTFAIWVCFNRKKLFIGKSRMHPYDLIIIIKFAVPT